MDCLQPTLRTLKSACMTCTVPLSSRTFSARAPSAIHSTAIHSAVPPRPAGRPEVRQRVFMGFLGCCARLAGCQAAVCSSGSRMSSSRGCRANRGSVCSRTGLRKCKDTQLGRGIRRHKPSLLPIHGRDTGFHACKLAALQLPQRQVRQLRHSDHARAGPCSGPLLPWNLHNIIVSCFMKRDPHGMHHRGGPRPASCGCPVVGLSRPVPPSAAMSRHAQPALRLPPKVPNGRRRGLIYVHPSHQHSIQEIYVHKTQHSCAAACMHVRCTLASATAHPSWSRQPTPIHVHSPMLSCSAPAQRSLLPGTSRQSRSRHG